MGVHARAHQYLPGGGLRLQIITVPNSILAKRKNIGRDPYEVSLDTVRGFAKDIASLGFRILP